MRAVHHVLIGQRATLWASNFDYSHLRLLCRLLHSLHWLLVLWHNYNLLLLLLLLATSEKQTGNKQYKAAKTEQAAHSCYNPTTDTASLGSASCTTEPKHQQCHSDNHKTNSHSASSTVSIST
jgi:hypothetical protein